MDSGVLENAIACEYLHSMSTKQPAQCGHPTHVCGMHGHPAPASVACAVSVTASLSRIFAPDHSALAVRLWGCAFDGFSPVRVPLMVSCSSSCLCLLACHRVFGVKACAQLQTSHSIWGLELAHAVKHLHYKGAWSGDVPQLQACWSLEHDLSLIHI